MKNWKKTALTISSYAAVAALAIGGTLAYVTASDSDTNVMTNGNVKIEQHEYQRAEGIAYNAGDAGAGNGVKIGALEEFKQGKMLLPAVPVEGAENPYTAEQEDMFYWGDYVYSGTAANGLWNDTKISNVMDKMVFVENTGKTDAFVRTIIAFECPEGMEYGEGSDKEFMMNINGSKTAYEWVNNGYVTIDGDRYLLMEATYLKTLAPKATAHPSLLQVLMTEHVTSEDIELLGDTYEILVLSQAVQAEKNSTPATMLDKAFGDVNAENAIKWFEEDDTVVAAPEAGAVRPAGVIPNTEGEVINHLVVTDDSDDTTNLRALYTKNGNMTDDLYVLNSSLDGTYAMNVTAEESADADLIVENTEFKGWVSFSGFDSATFTDCTFGINSEGTYNYFRAYDETVLKNCAFVGTEIDVTTTEGVPSVQKLVGDITFIDCTYNGKPITEDMLKDIIVDYGIFDGVSDSVRIG